MYVFRIQFGNKESRVPMTTQAVSQIHDILQGKPDVQSTF